VRTQESGFGNFVADSLKAANNADIAIINSGVTAAIKKPIQLIHLSPVVIIVRGITLS